MVAYAGTDIVGGKTGWAKSRGVKMFLANISAHIVRAGKWAERYGIKLANAFSSMSNAICTRRKNNDTDGNYI